LLASYIFGAKLASYKVNNDYSLLYSSIIFFCGVCLIDIIIARESIYWLTGSFNYVYPILMLLIYWYMLLKFCDTGKNFLVILLLSFLASATVEQVAMMTFGLTILTLINYYVLNGNNNNYLNKNKILIILFFVTIGTFSVILSPSTFIRYALEISKGPSLSFFESLKMGLRFLINVYIFSDSLFLYNIITIVASLLTILSYKDKLYENNKTIVLICKNTIILSVPIIFINRFVFGDIYLFSTLKLISSIYMLITYFIIFIVLPIILYNKNIIANWTILPITIILLLGSQIMIIFSPVYGYRNILCGIIMLVLYAAVLISNLKITKAIILNKFLNYFLLILILFSFSNIIILVRGYSITNKIDKENISRIINYQNGMTESLYLKILPNEDFGWSMPYYSEYHEKYYMKYYNINTKINWVKAHSVLEDE
jgi:hypothetical protein